MGESPDIKNLNGSIVNFFSSLIARILNANSIKNFLLLFFNKRIETSSVKGVDAFLKEYHSLYTFFIISETPQEELERLVKARNWKTYFQNIYGSPKSKIAAIQDILENTGFSPEQCIMVGDSMTDYHSATAFRIPFILRLHHENKILKQRLNKVEYIETLSELKSLLEKLRIHHVN